MKANKTINDINGMIILNKPKGMTSNDCLSIIKKNIHPQKIGHTGTLDKDATGVLLCLLGNATKSQEYLMKSCVKRYKAELIFGISTDTEDITGNIKEINEREICEYSNDEIKSVIKSFVGDYRQTPPMYSAKKVKGKKLLDLARSGIEIERKAEELKIYDIEVYDVYDYIYKDLKLKCVDLVIMCSKGTYIRTLCKDIGKKISTPSCMGNLCRLASGDFTIEQSITIEELKTKISNDDLSFIKPCYYSENETALTFGKFETLHLGHLNIISDIVNYAKEHNIKSTVMIVGECNDSVVLTNAQRISKLKLLGVDNIVYYPLDSINKNISAKDFVINILCNQLKASYIVVGSDCSFGYGGSGNKDLLVKLCNELNISCKVIEKLKLENSSIDISSTLIKSEYEKGNIDLVKKMLGK